MIMTFILPYSILQIWTGQCPVDIRFKKGGMRRRKWLNAVGDHIGDICAKYQPWEEEGAPDSEESSVRTLTLHLEVEVLIIVR